MLRHQPSDDTTTLPDRELGLAALLLLVTVVLTVIIVPAIA